MQTAYAELLEKLRLHLAFAVGELPRPLLLLFSPSGGVRFRYPDPNGSPLSSILKWAAGKSVMLSNWEHPLSDSDVDDILDKLDHRRLLVTLQCTSDAQAAGLSAKISPT